MPSCNFSRRRCRSGCPNWRRIRMNARAGFAIDPFSSMNIPDQVLAGLHNRLGAIEQATDTQQIYLATEKAESFVEALEVVNALRQADIFRIYQVIEAVAQARTMALML